MSLSQSFNAAAHHNTPAASPDSPAELGQKLLDLVSRPMNGSAENLNISARANELVQNGADLCLRDTAHGRTALIWATIYCRARILGGILARSPDLAARGDDGMTAMDHAKKKKNRLAIDLLTKAQDAQTHTSENSYDMRSRRDFTPLAPIRLHKRGTRAPV